MTTTETQRKLWRKWKRVVGTDSGSYQDIINCLCGPDLKEEFIEVLIEKGIFDDWAPIAIIP